MKDLLRVALILVLIFASTFVIIQGTGLVTEAGVRAFLADAHAIHPGWFVLLVILLLVVDLLIAVPTMATILLAGYILGPIVGGAAAATGLMLLGTLGYGLGFRFGRPILARLFGDDSRLAGIEAAFARNDLLVLFTCQALPILPELSCTLAGVARMRFARFLLGYGVGVVPFAFIVAWGGSASTAADPSPAIYTAIGVSAALLIAWRALRRRTA